MDDHKTPDNVLLTLTTCVAPPVVMALVAAVASTSEDAMSVFLQVVLGILAMLVISAIVSTFKDIKYVSIVFGSYAIKAFTAIGFAFSVPIVALASFVLTIASKPLAGLIAAAFKIIELSRSNGDCEQGVLDAFAADMIPKLESYWGRFGIFLPAHAREKYYEPSLGERIVDCYEGMRKARSQSQQLRLVIRHTLLALLDALDGIRMTIQRRLLAELDWVSKFPRF